MSRRRWAGALGALALTGAAAATGAGVGAAPAFAAARPMSACSTTTGVVLAVDFSHWGGPLLRACGTTPTTGYELLNEGGWRTTGTQHDGPAFICRIGYSGYRGGTQYPTPAQDDCVLTPPASAYWSYWHADPGQDTWSYSQLGAMSYHPKPGSVDLWIFGGTNISGTEGRPAFSPNAVRARNTAPGGPATHPPATHQPAPTRRPPGTPGTAHRSTGGATAGPGAAPAPSADRRAPATPSASASAAASAAGAPTGPSAADPSARIVDAAPRAAARAGGHGSGTPTLTAAAVVAVLGAGAGIAAWRRRRAGAGAFR